LKGCPEEQRRVVMSEDVQIRTNQVQEALYIEEIEDVKGNLEELRHHFTHTTKFFRFEGNLGPNDPVLLLTVQRRCERICKDELSPSPKKFDRIIDYLVLIRNPRIACVKSFIGEMNYTFSRLKEYRYLHTNGKF
jgi:hypothetical protein